MIFTRIAKDLSNKLKDNKNYHRTELHASHFIGRKSKEMFKGVNVYEESDLPNRLHA
jgi:hypothetical protein